MYIGFSIKNENGWIYTEHIPFYQMIILLNSQEVCLCCKIVFELVEDFCLSSVVLECLESVLWCLWLSCLLYYNYENMYLSLYIVYCIKYLHQSKENDMIWNANLFLRFVLMFFIVISTISTAFRPCLWPAPVTFFLWDWN